ncbi:NAD(P)H-quinone oxidoreductase subunit 3, chloroplastic [Sutcliffiella rhizosphaerae]|uniref:NADH-quinone oxidoreductase subunit A n=1 Tax=Sutcliffiella rhizosphaerae TaxID=2880967 RepID=A0ABN8A551_9BACI|nr:NAD(P)H-quinone oxidoreductase subunit 3, chloroplastic [Sutcliffiella rhizosphaerae]
MVFDIIVIDYKFKYFEESENREAKEGANIILLNLYQNNYLIVVVFLALGVLLPVVALAIGRLLRPNKPNAAKQTTYESGIDPFHDSRVQFNVRYYIFALLFVIFDVETVFLYPWAVAYEKLGIFALIEMLIFVVLLLIGLIYAWKKKVLKWI